MKFDFDLMALTYQKDPILFELYRVAILNDAIINSNPDKREVLLELQRSLDEKRSKVSSEEFLNYCIGRISENLENIEDLARCTKVHLGILK